MVNLVKLHQNQALLFILQTFIQHVEENTGKIRAIRHPSSGRRLNLSPYIPGSSGWRTAYPNNKQSEKDRGYEPDYAENPLFVTDVTDDLTKHPFVAQREEFTSAFNSIRYWEHSLFTGRGCTKVTQFGVPLQDQLCKLVDMPKSIPFNLSLLDKMSVETDVKYDENTAVQVLQWIYFVLEDEKETNDPKCKYSNHFINFGGVEILVRFLMSSTAFQNDIAFGIEAKKRAQSKALALSNLYMLLISPEGNKVAQQLLSYGDLPEYLFKLFGLQRSTYKNAIEVLGSLIRFQEQVFNLASVPALKNVLSNMEDEYLLKSLMFFLGMKRYANSTSRHNKNTMKHMSDANDAHLLMDDNILTRLIEIACGTDDDASTSELYPVIQRVNADIRNVSGDKPCTYQLEKYRKEIRIRDVMQEDGGIIFLSTATENQIESLRILSWVQRNTVKDQVSYIFIVY